MTDETQRQLQNRFAELAARAQAQGRWTETDFLSMAEQDLLLHMRLAAPCTLFGGYEGAERRAAFFGSEALCGYPLAPGIACLRVRPLSRKFAEPLSHRDVLGALMGLGIERRTTGDILLLDNSAYVFCLAGVAPYIVENLHAVRRTSVECAFCEAPPALAAPPEASLCNVASERLDALVAAVYHLGRSAAKALVLAERVYINGRLCTDAGAAVSEGAMVSVRGHGRFLYEGMLRETKKGRLCVRVRIYG